MAHSGRKKLDPRIRALIENGIQLHQRSLLVIVGDHGRDQARGLARPAPAPSSPPTIAPICPWISVSHRLLDTTERLEAAVEGGIAIAYSLIFSLRLACALLIHL